LGHTPVKENDHQNLHDPFEAAGVRYQCHQLVESGKAGCDVLFNMQTENSGVMHKLKYGFHVIYAHRQCFTAHKTDYNSQTIASKK